MRTLFTHIKGLAGILPPDTTRLQGSMLSQLSVLTDAWLLCEDGKIKDFGKMDSMPQELLNCENRVDASERYIIPAWCDSHTHIVFAAGREDEFVMKIKGASYEEIADAGGGILNSAKKLQEASEDALYESASMRLHEMILQGTGAVEIKSGYGLTTASELKMLRVIRRLKAAFPIPIRATFLAAHTYPMQFKQNHPGYIEQIKNEMLPVIANENLADFIDVFCEKGFFSNEETDEILLEGEKYGLRPKIHANQLSVSGAAETGIKNNALSVDHLEELDESTIIHIANSETIATLLPGCSFYLGIPFANARALINAGATVALASDFNPGSAPSGNMNLVVSLGAIKLKMLPEEAINAATINGAAAMNLSEITGSITIGKLANIILTKPITSLACIPYYFGNTEIEAVFIKGKRYE